MRIDLLLKREDFSEICSTSLQQFFQKGESWSGRFNWGPVPWPLLSNSLLVNHKLNVIYSPLLDRKQLRELTAEYRYNPNPVRRLLQSLFVQFGTTFPFDRLTAIAAVEVEPWIERLEHCCILPGNHTIRIVELEHDRCRVLLKQGVCPQFIQNEINVRSAYPFLPVPALLEWDQEEGWYLEERVVALPWNRIADADLKDEIRLQAEAALSELYAHSLEKYSLSEWVDRIRESLHQVVEQLPSLYDVKECSAFKVMAERLSARALEAGGEKIDTVQTHGDFQPANILVSSAGRVSSLYLIDWEYSARRYRLYDALVFAAQARFPVGLAERLNGLLGNGSNGSSWHWCCQDVPEIKLERWMVALFLLEDLLVRLEEMQIPDLKQKGSGLEQWMDEVDQWLD